MRSDRHISSGNPKTDPRIVSTHTSEYSNSTACSSSTRYNSCGYIVRSGHRYKDGKPYDPIEETPEYQAIKQEADALIEQRSSFMKNKLGYNHYYNLTKQEVLKDIYGIEWSSEVKVSRRQYGRHSELYDAVEDSQKYREIAEELEAKINDLLGSTNRGMGFCHTYWHAKKEILKRDYGIDWCSPAELNEGVSFD